jgi:hypothetical protein
MKRHGKSPYESHGRSAICFVCKETFDEKALKIFVYTSKRTGNNLSVNVCRRCEVKKDELVKLVIDFFKEAQRKHFAEAEKRMLSENDLDDAEGSNIC